MIQIKPFAICHKCFRHWQIYYPFYDPFTIIFDGPCSSFTFKKIHTPDIPECPVCKIPVFTVPMTTYETQQTTYQKQQTAHMVNSKWYQEMRKAGCMTIGEVVEWLQIAFGILIIEKEVK